MDNERKLPDLLETTNLQFDTEEPLPGHESRFVELLDRQEGLRRRRSFSRWLSASVSVAALAALVITMHLSVVKENACYNVGVACEVINYYNGLLEEKANEISILLHKLDKESRAVLQAELTALGALDPSEEVLANLTEEEISIYAVNKYNALMESLVEIESVLESK